jgi:Lytic transglycolase
MQRYLARVGVAVFGLLLAIAVVTERQTAGESLVASAIQSELPTVLPAVFERDRPRAVAAFQRIGAGDLVIEIETVTVVLPPAPPAVAAAPTLDGVILASWYGPGFYGNRTACGQTYTPEILGVAHKTLPCGTLLTITHGTHTLTVAVIDRGPYVAGRTLDLSNAVKLALGCTDLCTLRMQIAH